MFLLLLEPRFEVHVLDKKEHNGWSMIETLLSNFFQFMFLIYKTISGVLFDTIIFRKSKETCFFVAE